MMFKNMTFSARIIAGFAFLLASLLLVVTLSLATLRSTGGSVQQLVAKELLFSDEIQTMRSEVGNLRRYEKDAFINLLQQDKRSDYVAKWEKSLAAAREHLAAAGKVAPAGSEEAIRKLEGALASYERGFRAVLAQIDGGAIATTQDANHALGPVKDEVRSMEDGSKALLRQAKDEAAGKEQEVLTDIAAANRMLLLLSSVALLVGTALAWWIAQSIRQPLAQICSLTEELASSRNLTMQLPAYGRNEVGRVAVALNGLVASVRGLIGESHQHSARLVGAAEQLSGVSESIADAATNQSHAAASSAAAIEELTVSVNLMADNAHGVELQARSAAEAAQSGSGLAQDAASQIQHIAQSIAATSDTINNLNQRSSEIGNIVNVIRDIADQTNLLALNAAIEAARAGEMGRGFAVVADEVRKLAERTSLATAEISERIQGVQSDTQIAFQNMQQANTMIDAGVQGTDQVAQSLQRIMASSLDSVAKVAEMVSAIREQSIASQDIARNVEQIAQMNDHTRQAVQQVVTLAGDLKQQSGELDDSITRFQV